MARAWRMADPRGILRLEDPMPLVFLLACSHEPEPPFEPDPQPDTEVMVSELALPSDPWSPVRARVVGGPGVDVPSTMTVVGPSGPVDLTVRRTGDLLVGHPQGSFEPGEHVLTELAGLSLSEGFQILPYGMDPGFQGLEVGDAFTLDVGSGWFARPPSVEGVVEGLLVHSFVLEITAVREGEVDYRVIVVEGEHACSGHTGTASVDAEGYLEWSEAELEFPLLGSVARLYDASLRLGVLDDTIGGVRIAGVLDTGPLGVLFEQEEDTAFCDLLGAFGDTCAPCPGGTDATCATVDYLGGSGAAFDIPWSPGATMAACDVDPEPADVPQLELPCAPSSCDTHGAGGAWGLAPLALLVLRRRR